MKTFSIDFPEIFKLGLRADFRAARNQQALTYVKNLKPSPEGLVRNATISQPLSAVASPSWPFPQIFRGQQQTLLLGETTLWRITEGTWTATILSPLDLSNLSNFFDIVAGGPWHVADFGKSFLLANGSDVIISANQDPTNNQQISTSLAGLHGSAVSSVCAFRGRAIYGLDLTHDLFGSDWIPFFVAWLAKDTSSGFDWTFLNPQDPLVSMVAWSGVGDKMLWPFQASTAINGILPTAGGWDQDNFPLLFEWMQQNDWGFCPLPSQGVVLRVLSLENAVIVYGTNGITAMLPASVESPTFGFKKLLGFGIASRSAVGGDLQEHRFVDKSGYLWILGTDLVPKRLGYREFLDPMLENEIVVSFDPRERDFYISDGVSTYVSTPSGLGATDSFPTELAEVGGGLISIDAPPVASTGLAIGFRTQTLDFGSRDIKRINTLALSSTGLSSIQVRAHYRLKSTTDFFTTNWRTVNSFGSCFLLATGVDFMFEFRGTINEVVEPKVDSLRVYWQNSGKRLVGVDVRSL